MTWHRIWGIKCNADDCASIFVTENPAEEPEGWVSDGTRHICADCLEKQRELQADAAEESASDE